MFKPLLVSLEISRPHNMAVAALSVVAGYVIAGGAGAAGVWPTALFTALVTGAGNIINDYHDVGIDRINKPGRPLPSGRMKVRTAAALYAAATLAITAGAIAFLPTGIAALMVGWQASLYIYARRAKRAFPWGNLLVSSVTSSAFVAGGLVAGNVAAVWIPVAVAFVFILSRELVKGAEDVEGDAKAGVSTAAAVFGAERTLLLASALMLSLAAAIPLPGISGHFGVYYLWTMELTVVPGLLAASYLVLKSSDKRTCGRVSWLLKIEMFFGVLAMGVGTL